MADWRIVDTHFSNHPVDAAIRRLFDGNGTIYLVTGFFTYNGYLSLRDEITAFLERSPDNRLVLVVGPSADQFSKGIARDLRRLDSADRITLMKYPHGFLHAKLYLREGPVPAAVITSANLTTVAFDYNVELGLEAAAPEVETVAQLVEWINALLDDCEPLRRRDLVFPVRLWTMLSNWGNKGRLLPARYVLSRAVPLLLLVTVAIGWSLLGP